jgi:hypothetical protein
MSIFKSTIKEHLRKQIEARQNLLDTRGERPIQFQQYVSSKSPWVKMTSFVDFEASPVLANNYVLLGGALYPETQEAGKNYSLRSGISVKGASYGSNLGSGEYGIRPMPGIESVNIKSLGAYGSLRESTIKYYAWDLKQLENLNILFMKPGYPVLLEWGWSMYIDDTVNTILSDFKTIDCFASNLTLESIYERIAALNVKYRGNYDASLGLIKNYSYTMMQNGGFECTTTLISIGDVIDTIKMNSTSVADNKENPSQDINTTDIKDQFELLITDLANKNDSGFISSKFEDVDNSISDLNLQNPSDIDTLVYSFGKVGSSENLPDKDDRYTKYVQLAYFLHILNNRTNLFLPNSKTLAKIEIPLPGVNGNKGNGLCLASYNSMTIDNTVCIIKNPEAKILDPEKGFSPFLGKYIKGYIYQSVNNYNSPTNFKTISELNVQGVNTPNTQFYETDIKPYLYKSTNLGIIGNIYVNIGKIISIYKTVHRDKNGYVNLGDFIKRLLSDIQYTLGSVNSFDIFVEDNKCVIIDKHYVEDPEDTKYTSKFSINIIGTNTIVREHKLVSKIFQEQATMIAIAAQDRENIASIQSSTMVSLNKKIYNRIYLNTSNKKIDDPEAEKNTVIQNIMTLLSYVKNYIVTGEAPSNSEVTVTSLNTFLNQLIVIADRGTDYKGIIPLSLELTIDGIGGFTIGEIFTINKDVLPEMYFDKRVGFIITGISQNINRPDWTTTLTTQFCLLDQDIRQKNSKQLRDEYLSSLETAIRKSTFDIQMSIGYYNLLICFIHDFFNNQFDIINYTSTGANLEYKSGGNALYQKMVPIIKSYNIEGGQEAIVKRNLGSATNTGITKKEFDIVAGYEKDPKILLTTLINTAASDKKVNIIKYLNYVVKNNRYYDEMSKSQEVKSLFDSTYNLIVNRYNESLSVGAKVLAYTDLVSNAIISTIKLTVGAIGSVAISGALPNEIPSLSGAPSSEVLQNIAYIANDGIIKVNYLNQNAVDSFGKITINNIKLNNSIDIDTGNLFK